MRSAIRRRSFVAVSVVVACAAVTFACGDDYGGSKDDATVTPPSVATRSPGVSPAATTAGGAATVGPASSPTSSTLEVRGIVGAVNTNAATIEITRLSGAEVTTIAVLPTTRIRRARGGTATLAEIRPSDRIIASGQVDDRTNALAATEITVEDVVPGAAPGG